jgi:pyruvate carboxylase
VARQTTVVDRSVASSVKERAKADPAIPAQVGAPIPGLVTMLSVGVGTKVVKGDKLLTLEAMKMQTTLYAPCDGTVEEVHAKVGDTVESKDLLVLIKE